MSRARAQAIHKEGWIIWKGLLTHDTELSVEQQELASHSHCGRGVEQRLYPPNTHSMEKLNSVCSGCGPGRPGVKLNCRSVWSWVLPSPPLSRDVPCYRGGVGGCRGGGCPQGGAGRRSSHLETGIMQDCRTFRSELLNKFHPEFMARPRDTFISIPLAMIRSWRWQGGSHTRRHASPFIRHHFYFHRLHYFVISRQTQTIHITSNQ